MKLKAVLCLSVLFPITTANGQQPIQRPDHIAGQVVRFDAGDTVAAPGARVVLHLVAEAEQGPVDSVLSDQDGRFVLALPADTAGVLLVSARWQGIEYFATPYSDGTDIVVLVADTSSSAPVSIAARHLIIGGPAADGTRDVVDLVVIRNAGQVTRVASDSLAPGWRMLLPPAAVNVTLGDADFSSEYFDLHADTLYLGAAIPPGDRQFFLQYQIVGGNSRLVVPLDPTPDTVSVLAEEHDLEVLGGPVLAGIEELSGRSFRRWSGGRSPDGLVLMLPGDSPAPGWLLPSFIVAIAGALGWLTWKALARPRRVV